MNTYISSKEELKELIQQATTTALLNAVPELLKGNKPKYLNKRETMQLLCVSAPTLQRMRDERRIPFVQDGRKILYPYDGLIEYMEAHQIRVKG